MQIEIFVQEIKCETGEWIFLLNIEDCYIVEFWMVQGCGLEQNM